MIGDGGKVVVPNGLGEDGLNVDKIEKDVKLVVGIGTNREGMDSDRI